MNNTLLLVTTGDSKWVKDKKSEIYDYTIYNLSLHSRILLNLMQQFSKKAVVFLFIKHIINHLFQGNTKYDVLEKPVQNGKTKL
jgi:hypothetical protein